MESDTVHKPLLLSPSVVEHEHVSKTSFAASLSKLIIKYAMWAVFIIWVSLIFVSPAEFNHQILNKWIELTGGTVFGITGSIFLMLSAPILVIAILAVFYLVLSGEEEEFTKNKSSRYPSLRLWTLPVTVDGPFGVVSAAEFIGILLFAMYVIWAVYAYTLQALHGRTFSFLEYMGFHFGGLGINCLAFLFLPIARGSVLLRLIDIPFEHATKYHVWLGHLTMVVFTFHGLFYVIQWALDGHLLKEILEWKDIGVANLAGVISLIAGLLMWVTSLPPVRKLNFELFFYIHQLYIVFIVFLALHVGDFVFCFCAGGIFLFMLDRFLRFCQSRRVVEVLSAKCLPCGTVELTFSKPASLRYNALSFVFLQIRELSWLQWHPFSVSSSPLDGKYHMSVLIKVLGEWTEKLRASILNNSSALLQEESPLKPQAKLTASIEGPYGHESPYHLMYENLVLVAGGIGISPFLAILRDILHRISLGKPCLPRNISIIWAVKNSTELPLLSSIDMESLCPFFSEKLNIETHIYVTRESGPPLEEGDITTSTTTHCPVFASSKGCGSMSGLVGTEHKVWAGLYLIVSTFSFILLMGLLEVYYINPHGITKWWYKGLLFMACMTVSIVIFGGAVVGLWHLWEAKISKTKSDGEDVITVNNAPHYESLAFHQKDSRVSPKNSTRVNYGVRPDFKDVFAYLSKSWGSVDVGVLVCGPPTLQTSVAKEIRSHNFTRNKDHPVFHFNSHSFDL